MISNQVLRHEELLVIEYQTTQCSRTYGKLYKMFYQQLFDYVCKITKSADDAFDIVQDTFIQASTEVMKLRQPITFRFWLFRIAKNKCMRHHKIANKIATDSYEEDIIAQDYDTTEAIERDFQLEHLSTVLSNLALDEQQLLVAKYADGVSIKELMDTTGLGSSAIKMKLMRSKQKLATAMA